MMCLAAMTASAQTARQSSDSLYIQKSYSQEQMLMPVNPTYLKHVSEAANWGRNWFIEAKGGASAFLGTPIGCGDVFDRVTPLLQIGVGMIHNSDWINNSTCQGSSSGSHPFAFTYGVEARYRISDRVHLVGEVRGMLTARNFDGIGTSTKFGDNILSVSAGLSFTIGKTGWKRVVDATPYIEQNLALQDYIAYMRDRNAHLEKRLAGNDDGKTVYPKNSYSGLNSLRARLSMNGDSLSSSDRLKVSIGVPVYFFFKLNSDKLVDKSQLVNLDDIAKMAKQENLKIKISGAADSATGTQSGNQDLGKRRAKFIAKALIKRGVDKSQIKAYNLGGIDKYAANEANRFTTVVLLK